MEERRLLLGLRDFLVVPDQGDGGNGSGDEEPGEQGILSGLGFDRRPLIDSGDLNGSKRGGPSLSGWAGLPLDASQRDLRHAAAVGHQADYSGE